MSRVPSIEFRVVGARAVCSERWEQYFSCSKKQWSPGKRGKRPQFRTELIGWNNGDGTISVPLPAVLYLAKAGHIIPVFHSLPEAGWRPLDWASALPAGLQLRPAQVAALTVASTSRFGNFVVPMAVGKTEVLLCLAEAARNEGTVLVLAPSVVTVNNFVDRCAQYGVAGVVSARDWDPGDESAIVVARGPDLLVEGRVPRHSPLRPAVTTILSDEAQSWHQMKWIPLLMGLPRVRRSLSFSATSVTEKEEGKLLTQMEYKSAYATGGAGRVVYRAPVEESSQYVDMPRLVNLRYQWPVPLQVAEGVSLPWKWYLKKLESNFERWEALGEVLQTLHRAGRISVVPLSRKDFAKRLAEYLPEEDVYLWFGSGEIYHRGRKVKEEQVRGDLRPGVTILATPHLEKGWNVPAVNTLLLCEGKDFVAITQRSGRVIRKSDVEPVVINFFDNESVFEYQAQQRQKTLSTYYKRKFRQCSTLRELRAELA